MKLCRGQPPLQLSLALLLLVVLSACGKESKSVATPTLLPTPVIDLSATSMPTGEGTTTGGSPEASESTVGVIADRIAAAWPGVRTYRITSMSWIATPGSPAATGTPEPAIDGVVQVDEYLLPDRHHRIQSEQGAVAYELIVADGKIFARGPKVPGVTASGDPAAWIRIDPALVQAEPYASFYAGLLQPPSVPYSGLAAAERERIVHPLGSIEVNGRHCQQFRVADTTNTGERIDVLVAIDDQDLLCSIETRAGSTTNVTTFEFNIPLEIEAPDHS